MADVEKWLPAVGWEGFYEISSAGRVRSLPRRGTPGVVLKPAAMKPYGHLHVDLWARGGHETRTVHSLVAEAFIGQRPDGHEVRHLDGDAANNRWPDNIAYGTSSENGYDVVRHGRNHNANKTHCDHDHEFTELNTYRQTTGGRGCRECRRRISRESARRHRTKLAQERQAA